MECNPTSFLFSAAVLTSRWLLAGELLPAVEVGRIPYIDLEDCAPPATVSSVTIRSWLCNKKRVDSVPSSRAIVITLRPIDCRMARIYGT